MPYTEHWIALICPLTGQQVIIGEELTEIASFDSIQPGIYCMGDSAHAIDTLYVSNINLCKIVS